jgi:cell division initiation protein
MIDLTPLEVRQKKNDFQRSFRGYDAELVNDFLDLVADRMEDLVKQNLRLTDSVDRLEKELDDYRDKEQALSDALLAAQKLREDSRVHAEKESELLIREARRTAEQARDEASRALVREEETLRQVRARRRQLVESFRRLLERELSELEVMEETLELRARGLDGGEEVGSESETGEEAVLEPVAAGRKPTDPEAADSPDPGEEWADADEDETESDEDEDWLSSLVDEGEPSKEQSRSE